MPKLFHLEPLGTASAGHSLTRTPLQPSLPNDLQDAGQELGIQGGFDSRRENVKVPINKLLCTDEQMAAISDIYRQHQELRQTYSDRPADQAAVAQLLRRKGLDLKALEQLESRWAKRHTRGWGTEGSGYKFRWLLQCACGYSTAARQRIEEKKASGGNGQTPWARAAPYDFTGCLAHVDITLDTRSGHVYRIVGYLEHNTACQEATMKRMPAVPLHPHVAEVALTQLAQGAGIAAIQERNLTMLAQCKYREQSVSSDQSMLTANYRYQLLPTDFRSLYRQHHRARGVDIRKPAHQNVDAWLDPDSAYFRPTVRDAVFYYTPRTATNDRYKLCICTKDMEEAAWNYIHGSQLILDGTFGLSSSRLLVWIAMGVDTDGKGVPVAMFLFSAPGGSKATHAGYNTAILTELLGEWKASMSSRPSAKGRIFAPLVAITDTDTKERGALLKVWNDIILLLCRFHVRHCWSNKRGALLGRTASGNSFWKVNVLARIRTMENALLQTIDHQFALNLIEAERAHFTVLLTKAESADAAKGSLAYLQYMLATWMPIELWKGWSMRSRTDAAVLLKIPVEGVLPTTNHLESFNGGLKYKHVAQWQHSKSRLRHDILLDYLIHNIFPRLFAQLRMHVQLREWKAQRFRAAVEDGVELLPHRRKARPENPSTPRAWYQADDSRDVLAIDFHIQGRLCVIPSGRPYEIWATCLPSACSMPAKPDHPRYWLSLHITGAATCTCADWLRRGSACKHLRAFTLAVNTQMASATADGAAYQLPKSAQDAQALESQNRAWYGAHYLDALTSPLSLSNHPCGYQSPLPPPTMAVVTSEGIVLSSDTPPPPCDETPLPTFDVAAELQRLAYEDAGETPPNGDEDENGYGTEEVNAGPGEVKQMHGDVQDTPASATQNYEDNRAAIEIQVQQRIDQEIRHILPRLHGLSNILSDVVSLEATPQLLELRDVLDQLSGDIFHHCSQSSAPSLVEHNPEPPRTPRKRPTADQLYVRGASNVPLTPRKRPTADRPDIRAVSPERKQTRVDSRATL